MKKHLSIGIAVLAAGIIASGCVSSGTFKKMEAGKNEEIATLQQEKSALDQQNSKQKEQIASLEQHNTAQQQQMGTLAQQKGSLEQQKAALLAASQQRQQQYDALVQGLSKEVEKGQLQVRQYKNMLAVDLAEQIFFDSGRATLKTGRQGSFEKGRRCPERV